MTCQGCGGDITPNAFGRPRTNWCSRECRRKSIKKARRKSGLDRARVDRRAVFERDGWRCHVCGVDTPADLIGLTDPRAPELCRLLPKAQGGGLTKGNVACTCRSCNAALARAMRSVEASGRHTGTTGGLEVPVVEGATDAPVPYSHRREIKDQS